MYWEHLLRNEPGVKELTTEEYEKRMGIRPEGSTDKEDQDGGQAVAENPIPEDGPQVRAGAYEGTKAEIIEVLKGRGFKAGELHRKRKDELIEML